MKTITLFEKISFFFLFILLLSSTYSNAQIRLVEVNPGTDRVTIKNFGASTVDISTYWFCSLFDYDQLSTLTVVTGSLNLASGATVVISGSSVALLRDSDADLGLYINNSNFGSASNMIDFMQWGDAGNGRESVANTGGFWTTGDFLAGSGPFVYNGNGNQNGVSFWQNGTLSVRDEILSAALSLYPNPTSEVLNIKKLQNVNLSNASIFDVTGRLLSSIDLTQTISEKSIPLNNISTGLYFIRITDDQGGIIAKRFIKE